MLPGERTGVRGRHAGTDRRLRRWFDRTRRLDPGRRPMVDAVIVAGGHSARFGVREKPLVEVDGVPMLARVARAVAPIADDLVINCRTDQREPFERALATASLPVTPGFAFDRDPGNGPVEGLEGGLSAVGARDAFVVACDLPLLDPTAVEFLVDEHVSTDRDATVPRVDGYRRPLCAVYSAEPTLDAARSSLASGGRRLYDVLEALETTVIEEERLGARTDTRRLTAVDDPVDLRVASGFARGSVSGTRSTVERDPRVLPDDDAVHLPSASNR